MDFKNEDYEKNYNNWTRILMGTRPFNPIYWDKKLPDNTLKKLRKTNLTYYSKIPSTPITVSSAPSQDCSISYEILADSWMRQNFLPNLLFPYNLSDYDTYDRENDRVDISDALYSTESPDELTACHYFLSMDNSDVKRPIDLVIFKLMHSDTILQICITILNVKKVINPGNSMGAFLMHIAFTIINARQSLFLFNNGDRIPYYNRIPYFRQVTEVSLPENLKESLEGKCNEHVFTNFKIFRNYIWSRPNIKPSHRANKPLLLEDADKVLWDLEPFCPYFTREGTIFKINRLNIIDNYSETGLPNISNISFASRMIDTNKGYAICDPNKFRLARGDKAHEKMFEKYPNVLLVLDTKKREPGPHHYNKKYLNIQPLVIVENSVSWLMFAETSFCEGMIERGKYLEDSSLLTIFCLACPDSNFEGFDKLIPRPRSSKKVAIVNPRVNSDPEIKNELIME